MSMIYVPFMESMAIEHVLAVQFVSNEEDLVIARSNRLQIYGLLKEKKEGRQFYYKSEISPSLHVRENQEDFLSTDVKLELSRLETVWSLFLIYETELYGEITSMTKVRTKDYDRTKRECILVAFRDAKVSLLEWDASSFGISTVSIHFYEKEEYRSSLSTEYNTQLIMDPSYRCATLRFYGDMFAIIPFRQKDILSLDDDVMNIGQDLETSSQPPYYSSSVISSRQMHEGISHIIDCGYLYDYREPTLAILYSAFQTSTGLLPYRQDTVSFAAVTLDLQQKASTAIYTVDKLPYDLFSILPLPNPIGGSLLIGNNELVHIDQAACVRAVSVNSFAKKCTHLDFVEDYDLDLTLNGAVATYLSSSPEQPGIVLLVIENGQFVQVGFKLDGRAISSLIVKVLDQGPKNDFFSSEASCITLLNKELLFIGSKFSNGVLLGWKRQSEIVEQMLSEPRVIFDEDREILNDLYGDSLDIIDNSQILSEKEVFGDIQFCLFDSLCSFGPIVDAAIGNSFLAYGDQHAVFDLVAATGKNKSGSINIFKKSIQPDVIGSFSFTDCCGLWTISLRSSGIEDFMDDSSSLRNNFDNYFFISKLEESLIFTVGESFDEVQNTEFDTRGNIIEIGAVLDHTRIVQVSCDSVRIYNPDISLTQYISISDQENPLNETIVFASIMDPYILLKLQSNQFFILFAKHDSKEIVQLFLPEALKNEKIVSACFFSPQGVMSQSFDNYFMNNNISNDIKYLFLKAKESNENNDPRFQEIHMNISNDDDIFILKSSNPLLKFFCFILFQNNVLKIHALPSMDCIFMSSNFSLLPKIIQNSINDENTDEIYKNKIQEILVTALNSKMDEPYILVRTEWENVIIYKGFLYAEDNTTSFPLRFLKIDLFKSTTDIFTVQKFQNNDIQVNNSNNLKNNLNELHQKFMVPFGGKNDIRCVYVGGTSSYFIIKTPHSLPHLFPVNIKNKIVRFSSFNTLNYENGFIYSDSENIINIGKLSDDYIYSESLAIKNVAIGKTVTSIAYHVSKHVYAICTSEMEKYEVMDEDNELLFEHENDPNVLPKLPHGFLELVSPKTWEIIDRYSFARNEVAVTIKSVNLEVSEYTKARKEFIAVGTGIFRGEDLAMRGSTYLFEIVDVIPEPNKPETNKKVKLICREEVKGVVSAICDINGYLLSAQRQKVIVRSLENDDRLVGTAFIDLNMYVSVAKSIRNLLLFGDIMKSICFVGFSEEPYKMVLFGKDNSSISVSSTEFLVDNEHLYFVVGDDDGNIHVFNYDPENSQSLFGQKLLKRGDFHAGSQIRSILMLPKQSFQENINDSDQIEPSKNQDSLCLCISDNGAMGILILLPEKIYRRLYFIQGQLINTEDKIAGLNPITYRISTYINKTSNPARAILDGKLLYQYNNLQIDKQQDMARKSGAPVSTIIYDLLKIDYSFAYL
ncbi:hypothetical protein T552_00417 [Pneumocystis carinii B80]|uniref:Uncharacterized protein n=1 Tax=Pneumocystis carinii (strain B80) TaxID=1408658 RepID=A0A0W4ZQR5_PNEC8|nr:hypothetical protein T552_00417 [Pneumocystis carinii B80]KTW30705.1 hypothetical protein T552_00417 [Pneumocystis carinii B80]